MSCTHLVELELECVDQFPIQSSWHHLATRGRMVVPPQRWDDYSRLMPSAGCSLSRTFSSLPGGAKNAFFVALKWGTNGDSMGLVEVERNLGMGQYL